MTGGDAKYDFMSYFWSDIFDMHIEAAGDESECDAAVVRGDMKSGAFLMLYMKEGRLAEN